MTVIEKYLREHLTPEELCILSDWSASNLLMTKETPHWSPEQKEVSAAKTVDLLNKLLGDYMSEFLEQIEKEQS